MHPGVLVNWTQLDFVKAKIAVGAQPWTSELTKAKNAKPDTGTNSDVPFSSASWTPHPVAYVGCGNGYNPDEGCRDESNEPTPKHCFGTTPEMLRMPRRQSRL